MANDTSPPSNDRTLPVPVNDEAASHDRGTGSAHGAETADQRPAVPWYRRRLVFVLAFLIIGLFLLHHFTKGPPQAAGGRNQQGNATITVGQSKTGDIGIYVDALGTVTPTYTVTVFSQITGRVMEVHYKEGQMVRKGESLIDIDPRPSEATLNRLKAACNTTRACWPRLAWTCNATRMRTPRTRSPNNNSTTRSRPSCSTRAR